MHIYQDISHFRAPYKSLLSVAGFGQEAPVAAPSTFEVTPMQINAVAPVGPDGIRRYTPASAAQLMKNLEQWNTIQQAAGVVKVEPYTQAQLDAGKTDPAIASFMAASNGAAWTRARVAEGNAVYAPFSLMWPTQPAMDAGIFLGTTPYTDKAAMQAASALPIGAYLAEPGALDEEGEWLENIAIAAGITVGVGLAVWALRKYMKRGGPLKGPLAVPNAKRWRRSLGPVVPSSSGYREMEGRYVVETEEAGAWWPQYSSASLADARDGARNFMQSFSLPTRVVDKKSLRRVYWTIPKGWRG